MHNRFLDLDDSKFFNLQSDNTIEPIKKEGGSIIKCDEPTDLNETKEEQIHTGDKQVDIVVDVGNRSVESANYKKNDTDEMLTVLNRCIKMSFDIDKRFAGEEDIGGFVIN